MEQNKEKNIGEIIHKLLKIEWMRYNMFSTNDIYKNIPMLVFRVDDSNKDDQIRNLEDCVACFHGRSSWILFRDPLSRRGNYMLTLAVIKKIREECCENNIVYNVREYLGNEQYKLYCEQAIQDIPLLEKHIIEYLKEKY